ncbi:hypothetical protein D3C79_957230 [compost metagenome]
MACSTALGCLRSTPMAGMCSGLSCWACSSTKALLSGRLRRMYTPTPKIRMLAKKGTRQPQLIMSSTGSICTR